MDIPKDTQIERLITDATHIAKRSNHPLAWHAVQCLQQLRAPLHTQAERNAAYDAVSALYGRGDDDALDDLATKLERYLDNDTIAAEAACFGRISVDTAIDQQRAHDSLDVALCSYWENAADTLGEVFGRLHGDTRYDLAYRAMERAFRDALSNHGVTCSLFI